MLPCGRPRNTLNLDFLNLKTIQQPAKKGFDDIDISNVVKISLCSTYRQESFL